MITTVAAPLPDHFTIDVTQADITWGKPCVADECAVALATKRALHEQGIKYVAVTVTERDVHVVQAWAGPARRYAHNAAELVRAFDLFEPFQPRTVSLVGIFITRAEKRSEKSS